MDHRSRVVRNAALAFVGLLAAANTVGAQTLPVPTVPGLRPTAATVAQILAAYRSARGTATAPSPTRYERWTISSGGLSGTLTYLSDGRDYRETAVLGPFTSAFGRKGDQSWEQDENGFTIVTSAADTAGRITRRAVGKALADASAANLRVLGSTAGAHAAFVLEADPPRGRPMLLFFDRHSGLLVRKETIADGQPLVTAYSDFRTVQGLTRAWHLHAGNGEAGDDVDERLVSFVLGRAVRARTFDIPTNRRLVVQFPPGQPVVPLPGHMADTAAVVRVRIGDRGLDFLLDSGSSGIVIDSATAAQLGLRTYGTTTDTVAGTFTEHRAIIPEMRIGRLRMHDVVVTSLPLSYRPDYKTRIVGLLGFDFIADAVVHLDFVHGRMTAIDPGRFSMPSGPILTIPVDLDEQVPMANVSIGRADGSRFIVDTGADVSMVFSRFATAHPNSVHNIANGHYYLEYFPSVSHAEGVGGGSFDIKPVIVPDLRVGTLQFGKWFLYESAAPPSFEGDNDDGLIGRDFLRFFDLYLDYVRGRIVLTPNRAFYKVFEVTPLPAKTSRPPPL